MILIITMTHLPLLILSQSIKVILSCASRCTDVWMFVCVCVWDGHAGREGGRKGGKEGVRE
jgi:hypothetical protein